MSLPTDSKERKNIPIYTGNLVYFALAHAAIAECSFIGNEKHNPGERLHWSNKSKDHLDCLVRHLLQAGEIDTDGVRHSTKVAWRALAALQIELEKATDERT